MTDSRNISQKIFADDTFLMEESKDVHLHIRIFLVVSECGGTEGNTYSQRRVAVMENTQELTW